MGEALCREAESLTPGVVTAWGKRGLLADGLDHLDMDQYRAAKLAALHCSPARTRDRIREAALGAMARLKDDPGSFRYPDLSPPYVRTASFRKQGDKPAWTARDEHPSSLIELMGMPFTATGA